MKKVFMAVLVVLVVGLSYLPADAMDSDGLWMSSQYNVAFMFRQNSGTVLVVALGFDGMGWEAFYGPVTGNSAQLFTLIAGISLDATVTFTSDTSASVLINNCTPNTESCYFPTGASFQLTKIY